MSITTLLYTMASLLAAIAVGFAAARLGFLDARFNRQLTKLVIYLLQPLMILSSVFNKEHLLSNWQVIQLMGVGLACYLILIPLSALIVRLLKVPEADRGTSRFMLIFANVGFMGYPVVRSLFGDNATFYTTVYVLLFQMVVYTYGVHLLSSGNEPFRFRWKFLTRPAVLAALLAVVIYVTNLPVPNLLASMAEYVGDLTTPLSMVVIGCSLASITWSRAFANPRLYALIGFKLIFIPLLGFAVARPLLSDPLLLGITTVTLAMPTATNATMLSVEYGGNQELASLGVFSSTILSMATIPAIMWLLFG